MILSNCCNASVWWTSYNREMNPNAVDDHYTCQKCNKACEVVEKIEDMTQAEKLQKLLDLALENGWVSGICNPKTGTHWACLSDYTKSHAGEFWAQSESLEHFLFDHDFIKALCKAKYEQIADESMGFFDDEKGHGCKAEAWQVQITNVAISTNRIGYLYDIFCATSPAKLSRA